MSDSRLHMETLAGMVVFARVAEAGGFTAAAQGMGLTKSAVSKQISALEDRLGVRLLHRTTRRMSLTDAGAALLERCRRVIAEAEAAEAAVDHLRARPSGVLRINVPMTFGTLHLAPALAGFMDRYPDVTVDMTLNDRVVNLVDEGYDLAVRIGRLADSSLMARTLAPCRVVLAAAPAYLARRGVPATLAELAGHDCLSYSYLPVADEWRLSGPDGDESVRVSPRLRANNGEALRAAALDGAGIVLQPTFIIGPDIRSGRLVRVLPHLSRHGDAIHAVWPSGRHLPAKVRVFIDFLAERVGASPDWDRLEGGDSA